MGTTTDDHQAPPGGTPAHRPIHRTIVPSRGGLGYELRELWDFRDTAYQFAKRDVTLRYRQTAMGVVWVILQPLMAAGIFTFVFGKVAHLKAPNHIPYFVFSYTGMMVWTLFVNTLGPASTSVLANNSMIPKVYFPRLILPLYVVAAAIINFVVSLVLGFVLLFVYHVHLTPALATLPLWVMLFVLLGEGAGMIGAAYTVRYRDVQYVIPVMVQFLLFVTPVAYASTAIPKGYRWIATINPLTGLLDGARWALLGVGPFNVAATLYSVGVTVVLLVLGALVFGGLQREFADVI